MVLAADTATNKMGANNAATGPIFYGAMFLYKKGVEFRYRNHGSFIDPRPQTQRLHFVLQNIHTRKALQCDLKGPHIWRHGVGFIVLAIECWLYSVGLRVLAAMRS